MSKKDEILEYLKQKPIEDLSSNEKKQLISSFKKAILNRDDYEWCQKMITIQPNLLGKVPYLLRTKELCELAVKISLTFTTDKERSKACRLEHIPKKLHQEPLISESVQAFGMNIKEVKNPSVGLQRIAIYSTPEALKYVSYQLFTTEELDNLLARTPKIIQYLPESFHTEDRLRKIFKTTPRMIRYFKIKNLEFLKECIQENPNAIVFLDHPRFPLINEAIKQKGFLIRNIPAKLQIYRLCETAFLSTTPVTEDLRKIDDTLLTQMALDGVLHPNQSIEQIKIALKNRPDKFHRVTLEDIKDLTKEDYIFFKELYKKYHNRPPLSLTEERYIQEINKGTISLHHVPSSQQTTSIIVEAIQKAAHELIYVTPPLKTYRICRLAKAKNPYMMLYSPYED